MRSPVLTRPEIGNTLNAVIVSMHTDGDIDLIASTFMPDHVHLLFSMGSRLRVGQIMGKFKALSRHRGRATWRWQDDGFEHRLRERESIEDYGFYIFMNPYRAGICGSDLNWPWWVCPNPERLAFLSKLESNHPVPSAWLELCNEVKGRIAIRG